MKPPIKALAAVGLGFIAFQILKGIGTGAVSNIQFAPGQATFDSTMLMQGILRIRWNVTITNNNPVAATLFDVKGQVFYGNIMVGNVDINQSVTLSPGQPKQVVLIFDIQAVQLVQDFILSIGQQGALNTILNVIKFKGTLYTSLVNIPINTNIQIAG